ncbi:MAG TPA: beta-ketoacyl-[acyl-carrier-protein] synthase family protein [Ktedonobacteraceae bacterium]|jgi:3-oxoacyl-(acyl-carrier-protein) synthase
MSKLRRVVITGLGVIAPNGNGREDFWQACLAGRSGVGRITRFDASFLPTRIAGEVAVFPARAFGLHAAEVELLDRGTRYVLAAANLALRDGGLLDAHGSLLPTVDRACCGVAIGTAMGPVEEGERLWRRFTSDGMHPPRYPEGGVQLATLLLSSMPATAIAAHHRLHGPSTVVATGCSAGADAIGQAFWHIQEGRADRMLAGGCDSAISLSSINVFSIMRALSTRNDEPARASRPYDACRDGFVMSEGAGVLLLEERDLAIARGATLYAELLAFVSNNNAHRMTALPADGAPLQELLRQALAEAGRSTHELGYINAHGSSTPANEAAETVAYKAVFGADAYRIPISATKSMIGHTQGAASAIETVVTALALHHQVLPPTINQEHADPCCDLDYVPNVARPASFQLALTHSSGFGGVNTALVLARPTMVQRVGRKTRNQRARRRVVVTGLGVLAPNGLGKERFWQACRQGVCALGPLRRFPGENLAVGVAGEISDFRAEDYLAAKFVRRTDRVTHLACAAVAQALHDAQLDLASIDPRRVGTVLANTLGGLEYVIAQIEALYTRGPRAMSAHTAIAWLQGANVGQVALRYGLRGYSKTPVSDTVGGLEALSMAVAAIGRGAVDIVFGGGSEALLHPFFLLVFGHSGLSAPGHDPRAYRPFDRRAAGLLLAEGAGVCVLEEYEHARRRAAPIYGEILGVGQTSDARLPLPPSADGTYYALAMRQALEEAHLEPDAIDYFHLDGRASPQADCAEAEALHAVFGARLAALPVSVPRTMFGHSYAAAGALDLITTLLALQNQQIPPTLNCEQLDPRYGLDLVREQARPFAGSTALIGGRGLSGSNIVLAVRKGAIS